ncbi:hypothetical protein NL676_009202 [Syzygium grande]|nr:hypothetical protein NL676_009202 [Syzygium grande]
MEGQLEKLHLNERIVKFAVEKRSKRKNCFMMYARGLSITSSDDPSYWKWVTERNVPSDTVLVEMAELLNVCWLEVHGEFDVSNLSPQMTYEVVFVIRLRPSGYGWEVPVNFRVTSPDGTRHERKESLKDKPTGRWIEIKAGEVSTSECGEGEMAVSMFETRETTGTKGNSKLRFRTPGSFSSPTDLPRSRPKKPSSSAAAAAAPAPQG